MLDGVAEASVALPPESDKLKSDASKFPEPAVGVKDRLVHRNSNRSVAGS